MSLLVQSLLADGAEIIGMLDGVVVLDHDGEQITVVDGVTKECVTHKEPITSFSFPGFAPSWSDLLTV